MDNKEITRKLLEFAADDCPFMCYYEGSHPACSSYSCELLKELGFKFGKVHTETYKKRKLRIKKLINKTSDEV